MIMSGNQKRATVGSLGARRGRVRAGGRAHGVWGGSPVEPAVPLHRLERGAGPERGVADRLHVVVRVEQDGRRAGRGRPVTDPRGLATVSHDLRVEASAAQQHGHGLGGPLDMRVVKALERDAGDPDQPFQVGADRGHLPRDRGADRIHSSS